MSQFLRGIGARRRLSCGLVLAGLTAGSGVAHAQLRVCAWNVTNYGGGRVAEFQTAVYGTFEGRSLAPDLILGSEFQSAGGVTAFLNLLNSAPDSPGDWAAASFVDGPDTDDACFYRTSKVQLLAVVVASPADPGTTGQPRNTMRYDIRPAGYSSDAATIACYDVHLKAGSATADKSRRLVETQRIHTNAAGLPAGWHYLIGGDFNIQSSTETAYQALVGGAIEGRFYDPIVSPGTWYSTAAFRFIHTQAPGGAASSSGGMDDRHDQLLLSPGLLDGDGLDYIGNPTIPYSTTGWDDPNHSYRCWGNDGSSFNQSLTTTGNTMVGPAIAQALHDAATGGGHLPVVLNMRVPATAAADLVIDFGQVPVGSAAEQTLTVFNSSDTAKWTVAGIADLTYSMAATAGFTTPPGVFSDAAGGTVGEHTITMDTSTPGVLSGTITIATSSPETPVLTVAVMGEVTGGATCTVDLNQDGLVDFVDYLEFLNRYETQDPSVDFNQDGLVDFVDYLEFLNLYETGC